MLKINPYFGDPNDEWWGWTEYDYHDKEIGINLPKAWNMAKHNIDKFIKLYIDTVNHEVLHIAFITETKFWALGEELTVRKLNGESMEKHKFDLYLKEYNISKVEGSKIKAKFYGGHDEHTRKCAEETRLRNPLSKREYGKKG